MSNNEDTIAEPTPIVSTEYIFVTIIQNKNPIKEVIPVPIIMSDALLKIGMEQFFFDNAHDTISLN